MWRCTLVQHFPETSWSFSWNQSKTIFRTFTRLLVSHNPSPFSSRCSGCSRKGSAGPPDLQIHRGKCAYPQWLISPSHVLPLFSSGAIHTPPPRSSTKTRAVQLQLLLLLFPGKRRFRCSLDTTRHPFERERRHMLFSKTRMARVIFKDAVKFSHIKPVDSRQSIWASLEGFGPHWPILFNKRVLAVLQNRDA